MIIIIQQPAIPTDGPKSRLPDVFWLWLMTAIIFSKKYDYIMIYYILYVYNSTIYNNNNNLGGSLSSLFRVMVRMDTPSWNYILGGWNYLK